MQKLLDEDVLRVIRRLPSDMRKFMRDTKCVLAGGFIRAVVAHEEPSDIDLFGPSAAVIEGWVRELQLIRPDTRKHTTGNAITCLCPPHVAVQFITRWTYAEVEPLIDSFDFTIGQAAIWFDGEHYKSACSDRFYADLAAKRLIYTQPDRNEDAGGSLLRTRKFISRGYYVEAPALSRLIARVVDRIKFDQLPFLHKRNGLPFPNNEERLAYVIHALLREVDPFYVIDGIELADNHEEMAMTVEVARCIEGGLQKYYPEGEEQTDQPT